MCVSVCDGCGKFGGWDYTQYCSDVTSVHIILYFVLFSVITSGRTQGTAAEADAVGEQQAEADAIGEQWLKRMQSGSSS